jgi:hypothetical protein
LLIAYTHNRTYILAADVDEAAHELQLMNHAPPASEDPSPRFTKPAAAPEFQSHRDPAPAASPWRQPSPPEFEPYAVSIWDRRSDWNHPAVSHARSVGLLLVLFTVGALLLFGAQQRHLSFPDLRPYVDKVRNIGTAAEERTERVAPVPQITPQQAQNVTPQAIPVPDTPPQTAEPVPVPDTLPEVAQPLIDDNVAPPNPTPRNERNAWVDRRAKPPAKSAKEIPDNKRMIFKSGPGDREIAGKDLEIEVYKAIRDRAITGVQVASISDGTVYLDGRVASPRQKLAAVRATLSVPGVKGVRDHISIDY